MDTLSYDAKDVEMVIFDIDGTIAESKQKIDDEMGCLLGYLLERHTIAIISGGALEQFLSQCVAHISSDSNFDNLFLLPQSGAMMYEWKDKTWNEVYSNALTEMEIKSIHESLQFALHEVDYIKPSKTFGEIIEDRGAQITFSGLGQNAPIALKNVWDPKKTLRTRIQNILKNKLGDSFEIGIGGSTSIDITRAGIDKAYGIRKLSQLINIPLQHMLFIGDALESGGNDSTVLATGIPAIQVKGPRETKNIIKKIIQ